MVVAVECMEHLQEPKRVIAEMARVLKKDGVVLIKVPKINLLTVIGARLLSRNSTHTKMVHKSKWIKLYKKCGFTYIGSILKNDKKYMDAEREKCRAFLPQSFWGRVFTHFGKAGNDLRVELSFVFMGGEYLLFKLENKDE